MTSENASECIENRATIDDIQILHKSDNFVIVNKRWDVLINSNSPADEVTVETQLCHLFPQLADKNLGHSFRFVHRLDYSTSGVLCLALSKKAAKWATKAFMSRKVKKLYLALVRGHVLAKDGEVTIDVAIGRDKRFEDVHRMCTVESGSHCDEPVTAKTSLIILEHGLYNGDPASKVILVPHTGRTHQLRVHCCHTGHPIVGDISYNADSKPYRMMLHAHALCIPMMHENIDVTASDPFTHDVDTLWCPSEVFRTIDDFVVENRISALNL